MSFAAVKRYQAVCPIAPKHCWRGRSPLLRAMVAVNQMPKSRFLVRLTLRQVDAKRMLAYVQTFAAQQDLAQGKRSQVQERATEALACSQAIDHASGIAIATCLLIRVSSSAAAVPHLQLLQALNRDDLSAQAQGAIAAIAPDSTTISCGTQPAKTSTCP
ncbi:MAG: hypothetical protein IGR92_04235 [Leptolyngbyaceae cyanobacterium T60_A2020_046]|nr:hypothetical protein [Leptolyngbyaceae cyanobacterium T60_A2020_046]